MKLKTPVIYFEARSGSRGAKTGNVLLPTQLFSTSLKAAFMGSISFLLKEGGIPNSSQRKQE
ncbi:hypothetical protein LOY85_04180, partial [Brevibacillus brevis]|uniref:hypothetical protein n=1 Tax=Brevibacillus brevis TaxID=1393 RepID=UPI001F397CC7